jgi:hypothetical protein
MGSSSGDDYGTPPQQPAPPGNMIQPAGSSVPYQPSYINFLGDTNVPSTGLTPQMLAQIAATNGPPVPPGGRTGGPMPPGPVDPAAEQANQRRQQLALTFMQQNPTMQRSRREQMMKDAYGAGAGAGRGGGFQSRGGNAPGEWG